LFGYLFSDASDDTQRRCLEQAALEADTPVPATARDSVSDHFGELRAGSQSACCFAPHVYNDGKVLVAVRGRPLWDGQGTLSKATFTAIAQAYTNGPTPTSFLRRLDGPFALAIVDPARRSALLAVDRMGIERLTFSIRTGCLTFGTSAGSCARFNGSTPRIREQALYDFLFMHFVASPNTIYTDVQKLPRASALIYEDSRIDVQTYWKPSYRFAKKDAFNELRVALHSALDTAVASTGADSSDSGAFLSGGLDSSTVAGVLARRSSTAAKTFTVGFGEAEYDEVEYARIAARHFRTDAHEYQMTPSDVVEVFPRIAAAYDEPFGNSSAAPVFFCAKMAADNGVTHLLAGDGGDELFGGNERYARQRIFEVYNHVPAVLRRGLIEPLTARVDTASPLTPLRKLKSYVQQANVPLPDRFETWNFVYREGRTKLLDADFAAAVDLDGPLKLMREVWEAAPSDDLLERMLWYDWRFTLAENDLRKVMTMCDLAGVHVSFPMLHSDVVELSTRIPPSMKMKGLELRSFYKRAMKGFLPDEILRKTKHGFGLPFGVWLKQDARLGDLIYSLLSDLKSRRIVSADFLDQLVDDHRNGHASYYGYAIWDLAMLEAWLVKHIDE